MIAYSAQIHPSALVVFRVGGAALAALASGIGSLVATGLR